MGPTVGISCPSLRKLVSVEHLPAYASVMINYVQLFTAVLNTQTQAETQAQGWLQNL